ncbi:MAG: hypothetical protein E7171_00270 [Firmicutes bacterium]|nr:hypothetical protein [Bacillota bacterium]
MLNQVIAVGRITKVKGVGSSNDSNVCTMTIAIPRYFKNENKTKFTAETITFLSNKEVKC